MVKKHGRREFSEVPARHGDMGWTSKWEAHDGKSFS